MWLVDTVQGSSTCPLCLDSANPAALDGRAGVTRTAPLVNSISGEPGAAERRAAAGRDSGCPVIALALDEHRHPGGRDERLAVMRRLIAATRGAGIDDATSTSTRSS